MDKRPELAAAIKLLEKQEMEILRLKYGDGKSYKEIAAALKLDPAAVGKSLFGALKKLGADGAASLSEGERVRILTFIHGELEQDDLQSMATRIEAEPGLRQEFETWLAVSDELEKMLAKPDSRPGGGAPRSQKKFWIAVAAVLLVSASLPLLKKADEMQAPEVVPPAPAQAEIPPAPAGQTVPPVDNLAPQEAQAQPAAEPVAQAETTTMAQPAAIEPAQVEPVKTESTKKMGVFASKLKTSKNLNVKKVLLTLQKRLDGKPSCVPPKLAHLKTVNVTIKLKPDGGISKMEPSPKDKELAACLRKLLDDKPAAFKPGKKGVAQINLALKNF